MEILTAKIFRSTVGVCVCVEGELMKNKSFVAEYSLAFNIAGFPLDLKQQGAERLLS